jgi:hypothetical protein
MTQLLKILPLFAAFVAAPTFAAEPDPHAGHHRAAAADVAKPAAPVADADAKSLMHACKMMAGSATMAGKGPEGKMMMDRKDMHCMHAPAAATGANAAHDHEHPAAPPK